METKTVTKTAKRVAALKVQQPRKTKPVKPSKQPIQFTREQINKLRGDGVPMPLDPAIFRPYRAPQAVTGTGEEAVAAMDWNGADYGGVDGQWMMGSLMNFRADGLGFFGYPMLSALAQRTEYRQMGETLAKECTREWIKIRAGSDAEKGDKIAQLEAEMKRLKVREVFRRHVKKDAWFGMSHIVPKIKGVTDFSQPLMVGPNGGLGIGKLESLKLVEPFFTTPLAYNTVDPTDDYFYAPERWLILGKTYHASRIITGVSREVPDLMKPAFNFGGVSLIQQAFADVNNYLRNRDNVGEMLEQFSLVILKTNMGQQMQGGGVEALQSRIEGFNAMRSNAGTAVCDFETESIEAIGRNIAGLRDLLAQSLEKLSAVSNIPLVKLLGISPSGLNASSDGEIRVFYDWISSFQEDFIRPGLDRVFEMAQVNIWGAVDPDLSYDFVHLWQSSGLELAQIEKIKADTAVSWKTAGIVDAYECREALARDEASMFHGLDLSKPLPELEEDNDQEPDGDE